MGSGVDAYGGHTEWEVTFGDYDFDDGAVCVVSSSANDYVRSDDVSSCVISGSKVTLEAAED
jgi:hypothetical protein